MNSLFNKISFLEIRLFFAAVISLIVILIDIKSTFFFQLKYYVSTSVHLFYFLCDETHIFLDAAKKILIENKKLVLENNLLKKELLLKNNELLLIEKYKRENIIFRTLLGLSLSFDGVKIVAKVLFTSIDFYNCQAVINRGIKDNVYIGQPVISDKGIVGQIISVDKFSSRVLLICDSTHALPVQIKRNNVRMILKGHGNKLNLYAECPKNIDIHVDDLLVTSGIGGRFPEGYPVATIINFVESLDGETKIIQARPTVDLTCLRYLLLIWEQ